MCSCESDGRIVQTECKTGDTLDFNGDGYKQISEISINWDFTVLVK